MSSSAGQPQPIHQSLLCRCLNCGAGFRALPFVSDGGAPKVIESFVRTGAEGAPLQPGGFVCASSRYFRTMVATAAEGS